MNAAVEESDRIWTRRLIELSNVIVHGVAAGLASGGGSWNKKAAKKSHESYDQMIRGLMARANKNIGKTHDIHGNPIATSLYEIRSWLRDTKVMSK